MFTVFIVAAEWQQGRRFIGYIIAYSCDSFCRYKTLQLETNMLLKRQPRISDGFQIDCEKVEIT